MSRWLQRQHEVEEHQQMQMAKWKQTLVMTLICLFAFAPASLSQILANPLYDQGMESFNAGQYARAQQIFSKCMTYNHDDEAAMYMFALCSQKLGQTGAAVNTYKQIMNKFPDSAACIRAQSAMAMLAPDYLKSWHAKKPMARSDGGQGIAPDLFRTERFLPPHDTWHFQRLGGRMVVDAMIDRIQFKAELDTKSEFSYIGVNNLRDNGKEHGDVKDEDRVIYRCDVDVANIHRQQFPIHLVNKRNGQPILGQDFLRNYNTTINSKAGTIYLTRISNLPVLSSKRDAAIFDWFEVPLRIEAGSYLVSVSVDGTQMQMAVGASDICAFSPDQIRQVNPGYLDIANENQTAEGSGMTNVYTGVFKVKYMQLGKINRRDVPAKIVEYGSVRFQANRWSGTGFAQLGQEFYKGWRVQYDTKRLTAKFIREVPKDAGPGLGQPQ